MEKRMEEKIREKINEFVDGRIDREEVASLLEESVVLQYYKEIKSMKEKLKELKVPSPDFNSKLESVYRRKRHIRYAFALALVVVILLIPFVRNAIIPHHIVMKSTQNETHAPRFMVPSVQGESTLKVEIEYEKLNDLLDELKRSYALKGEGKNCFTYTFEVESGKVTQFLNTIKEFKGAKIVESNIEGIQSPITTIKVIFIKK